MMSCAKTPPLCCVPPDTRCSASTALVTGETSAPSWLYASSSLSPSTHRQSVPAERNCFVPSARDHCSMPPTLLVGTCWSSVSRTALRGTPLTADTARKVLWNFSKSLNSVPSTWLLSGIRTRTLPLAVVQRVSLTSLILPLP